MGEAMVKRLLKAGFKVNVWNRTASKAEPLLEDGAVIAASKHFPTAMWFSPWCRPRKI